MARRLARSLGAAAVLLALCSSCFTTALWQGYERAKDNEEEEEVPNALGVVLLTPLTLLLDLCSAPFQIEWFGEVDGEVGDEDVGDDDC
ncbi:MAG: hypothetical protein O2816_16740 [Planctomycetota bacterium]|nr:hypothetical protein [Planctomycetota bacterium]